MNDYSIQRILVAVKLSVFHRALCSCEVGLTQSFEVVTESLHNPGYVVRMSLPLQSTVAVKSRELRNIKIL